MISADLPGLKRSTVLIGFKLRRHAIKEELFRRFGPIARRSFASTDVFIIELMQEWRDWEGTE
jgi:hypothetical protein